MAVALWLADCSILFAKDEIDQKKYQVQAPPAEMASRLSLSLFYKKCVILNGFPILSSEKVSDYALKEAAWLIERVLADRGDILDALVRNEVRFAVMSVDEFTTTIPEHSDLTPSLYWDKRARGVGATPTRLAVSCGEENLLCYPGDPYAAENILIHEFGHAIHEMGLNSIDPSFDGRLQQIYDSAMAAGLWEGFYASKNRMEYWAEGVQSWFDTNRENDHDHNFVNTRKELKAYDPNLANLLKEVFGDGDWRYKRPMEREPADRDHLIGYDPTKAPSFKWPQSLLDWNKKYQDDLDLASSQLVELKKSVPEMGRLPKSSRSTVPTTILFVNKSSEDLRLFWITSQGELASFGHLRKGESEEHSTFVGHSWLLMDAKGRPVASVSAAKKPGKLVVK